jgi:hypothetical protein
LVDIVHSYWSGLGFFWKKKQPHHNFFLGNFCATLLISCPLGLRTKNETYNVLALGCLGYVEPNTLMIMPFKPLVKLRFGCGIMP